MMLAPCLDAGAESSITRKGSIGISRKSHVILVVVRAYLGFDPSTACRVDSARYLYVTMRWRRVSKGRGGVQVPEQNGAPSMTIW